MCWLPLWSSSSKANNITSSAFTSFLLHNGHSLSCWTHKSVIIRNLPSSAKPTPPPSTCGPQPWFTLTELNAQNAATTIDQSGRTNKKGTPHLVHFAAWLLLDAMNQIKWKQTMVQPIIIYKTLSAIYLPVYPPQLSLSISYDLFIHFPLITPAMRRLVTQAPFRVPFHQIQQQHLLGFHQGDCSIRRQSSSN